MSFKHRHGQCKKRKEKRRLWHHKSCKHPYFELTVNFRSGTISFRWITLPHFPSHLFFQISVDFSHTTRIDPHTLPTDTALTNIKKDDDDRWRGRDTSRLNTYQCNASQKKAFFPKTPREMLKNRRAKQVHCKLPPLPTHPLLLPPSLACDFGARQPFAFYPKETKSLNRWPAGPCLCRWNSKWEIDQWMRPFRFFLSFFFNHVILAVIGWQNDRNDKIRNACHVYYLWKH